MVRHFYNDNKTTNDLLDNIEISLTSYSDAENILEILCKTFEIPSFEDALMQLVITNVDLNNSIKAYDKRDNKIYGILLLGHFDINRGSPLQRVNPFLAKLFKTFNQLNGHSFVIDERLRGCGLDKKILNKSLEYFKQYDIIWCGVEHELNTHNYWKRLGFVELFSNHNAKFYAKSFDKNIMLEILILKLLHHEKNIY